jgi:tetratricopeptide (TPR) repeat protein
MQNYLALHSFSETGTDGPIQGVETMSLTFSAALGAVVLLTALPAFAAPATHITVGENPSADCARAADAQSHGRLLEGGRQEALNACDQALDGALTSANRTATLVNRGILKASGGRAQQAIADFDAALARDPGLADVYVNRGAALFSAARYTEARSDFDRAIALKPENLAVAYFDRGMANEKSGDVKAAYGDYLQAQKLAPNFEPARTELARFHVSRVADNK